MVKAGDARAVRGGRHPGPDRRRARRDAGWGSASCATSSAPASSCT
ncbi:MAG: hypothetical protein MZV70_56110 [Desulfobacterales bacterium]|nr:hypothetical protein [Desulfobacterales bacterium]